MRLFGRVNASVPVTQIIHWIEERSVGERLSVSTTFADTVDGEERWESNQRRHAAKSIIRALLNHCHASVTAHSDILQASAVSVVT